MQLHSPFMTLFYEESQGVETGIIGRFTLYTRQETAPGFEIRRIESIRFRTNLENKCVDTRFVKLTYHFGQIVFHGCTVHLLITGLPDGLHPDPSKLVLGRSIHSADQRLS